MFYVHIAGIDIVRVNPEKLFRAGGTMPARRRAWSYMLENRENHDAAIPGPVLPAIASRLWKGYPDELLSAFAFRSRRSAPRPSLPWR